MNMHEVPIPDPEQQKEEWLTFESTAYTAYCDGCIGITYNGTDVRDTIYHPSGHRIIAADLSVLPNGALVEIEGFDELFVVDDIGGAIKGNRIDILMKTTDEANTWGVREVKIRIVEE